jgi:hypothetical protein
MNCRRARKLLPLYAGGDLRPGESGRVAAHLSVCQPCSGSAAAFAESRALVGSYEAPDFDAEFYDLVRRNVMREIGRRPPTRANRLGVFAFLYPRPQAFAYGAALAVLALALAFVLRQTGVPREEAQRQAESTLPAQVAGQAPTPLPQQAAAEQSPAPKVVVQARADLALARRGAGGRHSAVRVDEARAESQTRVHGGRGPSVAGRSETARHATPAPLRDGGQLAALGKTLAETNRKVLRIELQTGDPNVRIIWLSPQPANSSTSK